MPHKTIVNDYDMHFKTHDDLICYILNLNSERNDETIELLKIKHLFICTVIFYPKNLPCMYVHLVNVLGGGGGGWHGRMTSTVHRRPSTLDCCGTVADSLIGVYESNAN